MRKEALIPYYIMIGSLSVLIARIAKNHPYLEVRKEIIKLINPIHEPVSSLLDQEDFQVLQKLVDVVLSFLPE